MAIINTIKQKILKLDQGTFQNLCDQILKKYYNYFKQMNTLKKMNGFIITFIISRMIRYRKTPLKIFILSFSMIQIKRLLGLVLEK